MGAEEADGLVLILEIPARLLPRWPREPHFPISLIDAPAVICALPRG